MSRSAYPLFEKLVELHSWDPICFSTLAEMAIDAEHFLQAFVLLREWLPKQVKDEPSDDVQQRMPSDSARSLYRQIIASEPLLRLFRALSHLDEAPFEHMRILIQFADIQPDAQAILSTQDGAFARVLQMLANLGTASTDALIRRDLGRVARLCVVWPEASDTLQKLASIGQWSSRMRMVEQLLAEPVRREREADRLDEWSTVLLALAENAPPTEEGDLVKVLLGQPRLSTILSDEILAFCAIPQNLLTMKAVPGAQALSGPAPLQINQIAADDILERRLVPNQQIELIRLNWNLRIEVATAVLRLRRFVKLDALEHRWPELYRLLQRDPSGLNPLEAHILQPTVVPAPAQKWLAPYVGDENLARLLRLRPWLQYSDRSDIEQDIRITQAIPQATAAQVLQSMQVVAETPNPSTVSLAIPKGPTEAPPTGSAREAKQTHQNLLLRFEATGLRATPEGEGSTSEPLKYTVRLKSLDNPSQLQASEEVELHWPWIRKMAARLSPVSEDASSLRPTPVGDSSWRDVVYREDVTAESARDVGAELYTTLFSGDVKDTLEAALGAESPLRLLVSADDPRFAELPIECLYAPSIRRFLGLTQDSSILRYHPSLKGIAASRVEVPLRIIAVLSNPRDTLWLSIDQEGDILRRTLADAQQKGLVQLRILRDQETTPENVFAAVADWHPQVFHFVGHAIYDRERNGSALVVDDQYGRPTTIDSTEIVTLLAEKDIRTVFLNGCQTGSPSSNDAFTGLAQALVGAGISGVIATLRPVQDQAALLFAREFYRSFADGYTIEGSVIEARKALSLAKMDWSAYALFTCLTDLSGLRVGRSISQTR